MSLLTILHFQSDDVIDLSNGEMYENNFEL